MVYFEVKNNLYIEEVWRSQRVSTTKLIIAINSFLNYLYQQFSCIQNFFIALLNAAWLSLMTPYCRFALRPVRNSESSMNRQSQCALRGHIAFRPIIPRERARLNADLNEPHWLGRRVANDTMRYVALLPDRE